MSRPDYLPGIFGNMRVIFTRHRKFIIFKKQSDLAFWTFSVTGAHTQETPTLILC